ncbi:FUSC family protein [Kribbella sp. NPDC050241]|uniref:FUSC family protein n=1 Tax=Kribbella sp. NPDC050241 TaxID=3364115 RepID=UPI0037AD2713
MAASSGADEGAPPALVRVYARRTGVAVVLIVTLYVPVVVFAVISGEPSVAGWAMLSGVAVFQNLMLGGRTIAYLTVGLLTALTSIAIVSGSVPVAGAALMAIMCFWVGLSAGKGLHHGLLLIPLYVAFLIIAPPPWTGLTGDDRTTTSYLLWNMLIWGGGALWAVLVFPPLLRRLTMPSRLPPAEPWARVDTLVYTITITVLCTASTLAVLIWWPGSNGAWLVLTVLAVSSEPGGGASVKKTLARIAGTIGGVAIAAIVATTFDSEAVCSVSAGSWR